MLRICLRIPSFVSRLNLRLAMIAYTLACLPVSPRALAGPYVVDLHPLCVGVSGYAPNGGEGQSVGAKNIFSMDGVNGSITHALLQNGAAQVTDIHPTNLTAFQNSVANATDGVQQAGYGSGLRGTFVHALMWNGTADSAVDLNPGNLGINFSIASGVGGGQQAGLGSGTSTGGQFHAIVWSGTSNSAVDLNPPGIVQSMASATDGNRQVGSISSGFSGTNHAMVWSGTPSSGIDLHSTTLHGLTDSVALGVSLNQQVGYAYDRATSFYNHALLWNGTADSVVDLSPPGFTNSIATATNGMNQVGYGSGIGSEYSFHALLWNGTADSAVDLQLLLPPGYYASSASVIDAAGNIYGTAMAAGGRYAVEWAVPEPSSLFGVIVVVALVLRPQCHRPRLMTSIST